MQVHASARSLSLNMTGTIVVIITSILLISYYYYYNHDTSTDIGEEKAEFHLAKSIENKDRQEIIR